MAFRPFLRRSAVAIIACLTVAGLSSSATAAELLGYWQLEETDVNEAAIDSSGNGLDGTYEGAVDPNVPGAPGFGSGADFDGATGQILIGPGDVTGFGNLTNDFTVMAWINPDGFTSKNRVFGSPIPGGWGWGTAGTSLEITTYGVKDFDQAVPLEADVWTHAAVVLDSNNEAHFYANGEFLGTQTHPSPGTASALDFYIGFSCCAAEHFDGQLDEVGVFSGTLTEEQIQNAMNLGVGNFEGVLPGAPGDFNLDEVVDAADFAIMAENFNATFPREEAFFKGDFDSNTRVDLRDFIGFRELLNSQGAVAAVPEPTNMAPFAMLGLAIVLRARRRRGRETWLIHGQRSEIQ